MIGRRTSLTEGGLLTLGTQFILFVLGLVASIVLARTLGPSGRGAYALTVLIVSLLARVGSLGLEAANTYYGGSRKDQLAELASNSVVLAGVLGGLLVILSSAAFVALSPVRSYLETNLIWVPLLLQALLALPAILSFGYLSSLLLSQERLVAYNAVYLVLGSSQVALLILLLVMFRCGLAGSIWAYVLASVAAAVVATHFVRKLVSLHAVFNRILWWETLRYGVKTYLANMAQFLSYRLDTFLVAYFLGPAAVGLYVVAVGVAERLWMVPSAFATVLFPRVASGSRDQANILTPKVARHTLLVVLVLVLVLAALARPFMVILYGPAFEQAVTPLLLLLPGIVALSFCKVLMGDLAGRGRPGIGALASGISLFVAVALDLVLIPRWGISGASVASSASYAVATVIVLIAFVRVSRLRWHKVVVMRPGDFADYSTVLHQLRRRMRSKVARSVDARDD